MLPDLQNTKTKMKTIQEIAEEGAVLIDEHLYTNHQFISSGTIKPFTAIIQSALTEHSTSLNEEIERLRKKNKELLDYICPEEPGTVEGTLKAFKMLVDNEDFKKLYARLNRENAEYNHPDHGK